MGSQSLNIISLNIECDRHLERIIPFLNKQQANVVLLQEVLKKDIGYLEESTDMQGTYSALRCYPDGMQLGMLTLSNLPFLKNYSVYYRGHSAHIPIIEHNEPEKIARAILVTEIMKGDKQYCLINTHFTWSPNGKPTALQYHDLNVLLSILAQIPDFVLCGDFNAPRGTAIFDAIASKYKDNIPAHITTTIDKNLHKAGNLNLMVDGVFSTPGYQVTSVRVLDGLSDHCAILANIGRT